MEELTGLRVPPQSIEAEQSVLGALLNDNLAFDKVADVLTEADFYRREHQLLWSCMAGMIQASKPADVITVFEALRVQGLHEDVGGLAYINDLGMSLGTAGNIGRYAQIVRERSLLRQTISAGDEVVSDAFKAEAVAPVVERGIEAFTRISQGMEAKRKPKRIGDLMVGVIDRVQALADGTAQAGWPLGFPDHDRALNGGLRPGGVYVLAARPSVGKSSLAQRCGLHLARNGVTTLFLSQEMPEDECGTRAIAEAGRVDYGGLQAGNLKDDDWGRLVEGVDSLAHLPYWIDDQPSLRLGDIRAKARAVPGLQVLILDYVQLCESEERASNRNLEVEAISRGIKSLAKQMGIAVILLSQLNREVEKRPGAEPIMSDLRDSGAIEQDADVVWFLWSVGDDTMQGPRIVGSKLAKNRQGRKHRGALAFDGRVQRWGESTANIDEAMAVAAKARKGTKGGGEF
jgi:replicative DNA helicase